MTAKFPSKGVDQRASLAEAKRSGWIISGACKSCGETKRLQVNELLLRGRLTPDARLADIASRLTCASCGQNGSVALKYLPAATTHPPKRKKQVRRKTSLKNRSYRRRSRTLLSPLYRLFGRRGAHRLLLLVVALVGLYVWQGWNGPAYTGNAYVVDGDTIRIQGRSIRIWGIAAPELDEVMGQASKRQMARIVAGQTVTCE